LKLSIGNWPLVAAKATELLAAGATCVIFCGVLLQVLFNALDGAIQVVGGTPLGLNLPSYAEISGFLLASTTFLALAGTFLADGHIRVNLFVDLLPAGARKGTEIFCLTVSTGITATLCWGLLQLLYSSLKFGDTSYGLLPIPLWIPQSFLCLGVIVFLACLVRALVIAISAESAHFSVAEVGEGSD